MSRWADAARRCPPFCWADSATSPACPLLEFGAQADRLTGHLETVSLRLGSERAAGDGTWRRWRKLWRTHIALVALLRATDRPVLLLRNGEPLVRRAMSLLKSKLFFFQVCFFIGMPTLSTEL